MSSDIGIGGHVSIEMSQCDIKDITSTINLFNLDKNKFVAELHLAHSDRIILAVWRKGEKKPYAIDGWGTVKIWSNQEKERV